jgi:N-acetylneuraminic acid mutarotase
VKLSDFGGEARHRTPMLTIGNKIYTGQGHYNGAGTNILFGDWWEYDPSSNAWSQKADYGGGPVYHASGFVIGNFGYLGTGRITASGNNLTQDFFRYDPQTNSWLQVADFPGLPRRGAVGFTIGEYGYVGTGEPQSGGVMYNDFYRYNPTNDTWTQIASMPTSGRVSAVGFELDDYGFVGTGGFSSWGSSQNDFWRYDPNTNSWQQMADVGPTPRMEATGFSLNGKGYILNGDDFSSGTNYDDMYEYDPAANTWIQIPDFKGSARRYMAATTVNGLAYCGLGTNGTNFKDFWMFDETLSTGEIDMDKITIYPNPYSDFVTIDLRSFNEGLQHTTVKFMDYTGKEVLKVTGDELNAPIITGLLPNGNYLITISYKGQLLETKKTVKY